MLFAVHRELSSHDIRSRTSIEPSKAMGLGLVGEYYCISMK